MSGDSGAHWNRVFATRAPAETSWFEPEPAVSLALIESSARPPASILDVGAGTSFLVDRLLDRGFHPGVLDISQAALLAVQDRLGKRSAEVKFYLGDLLDFENFETWDVWHDRAVFHFLTNPAERARYRDVLSATLRSNGTAIIATFGPQGPERCSGLATMKYSAEEIAAELGDEFRLTDQRTVLHPTPFGTDQQFIYAVLRRGG